MGLRGNVCGAPCGGYVYLLWRPPTAGVVHATAGLVTLAGCMNVRCCTKHRGSKQPPGAAARLGMVPACLLRPLSRRAAACGSQWVCCRLCGTAKELLYLLSAPGAHGGGVLLPPWLLAHDARVACPVCRATGAALTCGQVHATTPRGRVCDVLAQRCARVLALVSCTVMFMSDAPEVFCSLGVCL
jgi:hypothetical protein